MKQNFTEISLKDTQIKKFNFLSNITFPLINDSLEESIKENGIITPIILCNKEGDYYLVDGHKRFEIATTYLNLKKIFVKILNYSSEILIFLKFFKINLYRNFNEIEFANLIDISNNYFKNRFLTEYLFIRTNKKYSQKNLNIYFSIKDLIYEGKAMLLEGRLNFQVAIKISKLSKDDQKYFLSLIENLKLNFNKQKNVFEKFFDLSKRYDLNFKNLIEKYFKKFIIEKYSKSLEIEFFDKLLKLHSPDYYNFIKNFNTKKDSLLKNVKGINILSPSNFEDNILKAEIFFKNDEDLKKKIKILSNFSIHQ